MPKYHILCIASLFYLTSCSCSSDKNEVQAPAEVPVTASEEALVTLADYSGNASDTDFKVMVDNTTLSCEGNQILILQDNTWSCSSKSGSLVDCAEDEIPKRSGGAWTCVDKRQHVPAAITGYRNGFEVGYNEASSIVISPGAAEVNGTLVKSSTSIVHVLTTLVLARNIHYIYIDVSESDEDTLVVYDSLSVPSFDATKRGWYLGDDRSLGGVYSENASATLTPFKISNGILAFNSAFNIVINENPDFTWRDTALDLNLVVPVMAQEVLVEATNSEDGNSIEVSLRSKAIPSSRLRQRMNGSSDTYIPMVQGALVVSRTEKGVQWLGEDNDDNQFTVKFRGWKY